MNFYQVVGGPQPVGFAFWVCSVTLAAITFTTFVLALLKDDEMVIPLIPGWYRLGRKY